MGFFDNIVSGIKSTVSKVVESVKLTSNIITVAPNITQKQAAIADVVGLGVVTAALNPAATVAVAKVAAAKPLATAAIAVSTPVVISAVSSSKKLQSEILNSPKSLANFGSNIGEFIDDPSKQKAIDVVKENPIIAGTFAGAAVLTAGIATTGVISNILTKQNTAAVIKNTEVMLSGSTDQTIIDTPAGTPTYTQQPLQTSLSEVPAVVSPTKKKTVKKKKKPVKKKKKPVKKKKKTVKKKKKTVKKKKKTVKKKKKTVKKKKKYK